MSAEGATHAAHAPNLQHHFETPAQQFESGKLGMWLFLATELLMFGGLFCAYTIFRANHPEIFEYAHRFLDVKWGGINTVVLLVSSFTMAWAVRSAQLGNRKLLVGTLAATILCASAFLGIKYVEYSHKIHSGLMWGENYVPRSHGHEAPGVAPPAGIESGPGTWESVTPEASLLPPAATGPTGLAPRAGEDGHAATIEPKNVHIFFGIYFAMTGLHGIHVLAGIAVIGWLLVGALRGRFGSDYFTPVDLVGLYWHVVDLIWIFLFPLLYLIH